jgi:hypothetical protein
MCNKPHPGRVVMVRDRNTGNQLPHTGPGSREDRRHPCDADAVDRTIEPSHEIAEFKVIDFGE